MGNMSQKERFVQMQSPFPAKAILMSMIEMSNNLVWLLDYFRQSWPLCRYYPGIHLQKVRSVSSVRIASKPATNQTKYLMKARLQNHHSTISLGEILRNSYTHKRIFLIHKLLVYTLEINTHPSSPHCQ